LVAFDPLGIDDHQCGRGHLDADPIYEVLLALQRGRTTGRLTIEDAAGENHMYFMQGQPVGVQLAEYIHPLGQLLLELGRVDGKGFVRAQRLIWAGQRLAGQVFRELGYLDEAGLKEVLSIQARKKAEHFCRYVSRPFTFCRGLSFLSGFSATPLNIHAVLFLAVRQQLGKQARVGFMQALAQREIRLSQSAPEGLLPAPLACYDFGPPEERFLTRLAGGFTSVDDLANTGTLPIEEMAVLLRYLELVGLLEARAVATHTTLVSNTNDEVFSTSRPGNTAPRPTEPTETTEPTEPTEPTETTEPTEPTDPRIRDIHAAPTELPPPRVKPRPPGLLAERPPLSQPFPLESVLAPEQKKKRQRRVVPEPSVASQATSETRKEKTGIIALPSIVIDDG
jgi:hypothetical protein